MTKVCLACKQELPIDLFRVVVVKGAQKHQAKCKPCMSAYQKAYYEANKERIKEQIRDWNKKHPSYTRDWQKQNPEKHKQHRENARPRAREHMREQYWKDPEAARLKVRQYKAANIETVKAKKKEWNQANRPHLRAYHNSKTKQLSDSYIRNKLAANHKRDRTLRSEDIPQELVELKRFQLLIQRELKNETHQ
jgi:hypothetical protein